MVFPNRREALWVIQVTANSGTRLAAKRTRKCFQRSFMIPPIFHLDGISSAGIYASPSIMSIKIKGNSEIECKVDIQGNYRYLESIKTLAILQISLDITTSLWHQKPLITWSYLES
jgi:hypothetical protein